jgi:hypothetical protein
MCDGRHLAVLRPAPHDSQSGTEHRRKKETQLMYWNRIARYAVDFVALASAVIFATPFALVISLPFLGAL